MSKLPMLLCLLVYTQTASSQVRDPTHWDDLQSAAHALGVCVYQVGNAQCREHDVILTNHKEALENDERYYFLLDSAWATRRIQDWATERSSDPMHYLMLLDADQGFERGPPKSRSTSSLPGMFALLDKRLSYQITSNGAGSDLSILLRTQQKTILSNTLWREFMSGRLGLMNERLEIPMRGATSEDGQRFMAVLKQMLE